MKLYWLKPNKVGIAFLIIFAILILYIFSFFDIILGGYRTSYLGWVISVIVAYPISMILGRRIQTKRKLRNGQAGIEPKVENRQLEWICFIGFLIVVAIPLNLGCFLLSSYFSYWDRPPPIYALAVYWSIFILPVVLAIVLMILKWNTAFIIFLTGVILVERFCSGLAFHTIGGIESGLCFFVICLNIIPVILFAVKFRKIAVAIILAFAFLLIPYNLFLGYRFIQLQNEAHAIVEYVYETKVQTGSYPQDLSGYTFKNPHLEKHIQGYGPKDNGFKLMYFVGTTGTSHWYDSKDGWHYYPD